MPLVYDFFFPSFHQVEIIKDLPEDKTITVYRCGPLVDLCRGPHIPSTAFVKAFSCLKVGSAMEVNVCSQQKNCSFLLNPCPV